jgi:hypothetical protein
MEQLRGAMLTYLSNFIDPTSNSLRHLPVHPSLPSSQPSRLTFSLCLSHLRWLLRLNLPLEYASLSSDFIAVATAYYGEYHPVFCELYSTFAEYYSVNGQHEEAIAYGKSSLVNVIALCGTGHRRTA